MALLMSHLASASYLTFRRLKKESLLKLLCRL
jgi:hypothetical protein